MAAKNIEAIYPLSPTQQGILFHAFFEPESSLYFEQSSWTFYGDLDVLAFHKAWQRVVDRHPALRTGFAYERREKPLQVVLRQVQLPWEEQDWRNIPAIEQQQRLDAFLQADRSRGFDFSKAPLLRVTLLRLAEDAYHFVVSFHHVLLDGWCEALILDEIFAFYEAFCQGQDLQLKSPRPYQDYISWLLQQDPAEAEAFWRKTLKGFTAPTQLGVTQAVSSSPANDDYGEQGIKLSAAVTDKLQSLMRQHRLTLSVLMQGVWALLLSRYSGEEDVIFGMVVSGRSVPLEGIESMVGLFTNVLPIRIQTPPETPFLSWLQDIQHQQSLFHQYESSPLVQIQEWSEVPRGLPMFESLLSIQNYPPDKALERVGEKNLKSSNFRHFDRTNYPLVLTAGLGTELWLQLAYLGRHFDAATITRILGHVQSLLEGIAANPERRLIDLSLLTEAERRDLLITWNDTQKDFPKDATFTQLFEAQVERIPEAIAVVFQDKQLTYNELNKRTNRLAQLLAERQVGPDVLVPVLSERGLDFLIAILAVFKAGGAYLPLDPRHPAERHRQILKQSQAALLLLTREFLPVLKKVLAEMDAAERPELLILEDFFENDRPDENLYLAALPRSLSYVIFTSGSTGLPKGAMVEQVGMVNHLYAKILDLSLTEADIIAQTASQTFDISVWQFLVGLVLGGRVHIFEDEVALDPIQLLQQVQTGAVSILETVPSLLRAMLNLSTRAKAVRTDLPQLRWLIPTGEALPPDLACQWLKLYPDIPMLNAYGPTECSDDVTHHPIHHPPAVNVVNMPIGHPIANMRMYILDRRLSPVPVGVMGELYVGGIGVGRGYFNAPERTCGIFIADPFAREQGSRLYKTGDLARYLPDGNIEFLGRIDHQVKLRGFRIELGEIEAVLSQHKAVEEVVVLVRAIDRTADDKRLVAYIVPDRQQPPAPNDLRHFLQEKLPDYMVPSAFVLLEALPLTANGKINRRALPALDGDGYEQEGTFVAPRTPTEKLLADIWMEVLGLERVSVHHNFFELGGHSLNATQVLVRINEALNINLTLRVLLLQPTIEELAASIDKAKQVAESNIPIDQKIAELKKKIERLKAQEKVNR